MKKILFLLLSCWGATAQVGDEFPVFPDCAGQTGPGLEQCFYREVQDFVFDNFKSDELRADVIVVFEVNREGRFVVQYIDAPTPELEAESRLFRRLNLKAALPMPDTLLGLRFPLTVPSPLP